jgi:N-acetylmuramoyl-L-alanine amidase
MKLAIDPGHGMSNKRDDVFDSGAVAAGVRECDIALEWALTGKYILPQYGINHFLTRDDNLDEVPVGRRDDMAAAAHCTHFLSIHCNAADGKATGVEVYYRDSSDRAFAQLVLDSLVEATGLKSRGLKRESESQHSRLAVLDFNPPACLAEIGFLDNPHDRSVIRDREVRLKFWAGLCRRLR